MVVVIAEYASYSLPRACRKLEWTVKLVYIASNSTTGGFIIRGGATRELPPPILTMVVMVALCAYDKFVRSARKRHRFVKVVHVSCGVTFWVSGFKNPVTLPIPGSIFVVIVMHAGDLVHGVSPSAAGMVGLVKRILVL